MLKSFYYVFYVVVFELFISIYGYRNFVDTITYRSYLHHDRVINPNSNISVETSTNSSASNTSSHIITDCVSNTSTVAVEAVLSNITSVQLDKLYLNGSTQVEMYIKDFLEAYDGYYDLLIQILVKTEDDIEIKINSDSIVVHRHWTIAGAGIWHVFIYPPLAPNGVCIDRPEIDLNTTGHADGSALYDDATRENIGLILGLAVGLPIAFIFLCVGIHVVCWIKEKESNNRNKVHDVQSSIGKETGRENVFNTQWKKSIPPLIYTEDSLAVKASV